MGKNKNKEFYEWFEKLAPKIGVREVSFRKIFNYLDDKATPIIIVETGCLREIDNFTDGQSTLLFDKYTISRGNGSKVYTVDIDPKATKVCKEAVSDNVEIITDSSVRYLTQLSKILIIFCSNFRGEAALRTEPTYDPRVKEPAGYIGIYIRHIELSVPV